jgi:pyruvate, water dikinase
MPAQKFVLWFKEVDKSDIPLVGGKGANLGEMINNRIPIPDGFIVTANAYYQFIEENKLKPKIREILTGIDVENPVKLHSASIAVKKLIIKSQINDSLANLIIKYYQELHQELNKNRKLSLRKKLLSKISDNNHELVAVRSSATAEDLPDASFAGQQATFLNIKGEAALLDAIRECWASLFEERAIYYRQTKHFDHFKVGIAVPVQRMVESVKSGIMFTIDPTTNNKKMIVIDAIFGLGELIVQGSVTPDHYEVDKAEIKILKKDIHTQDKKMIKAKIENKIVKLSKNEGSKQKLKEAEILELAKIGKKVENHYFFPQDMEWAIDETGVYIVQSRPITTMKNIDSKLKTSDEVNSEMSKMKVLLTGVSASPGIATGQAQILRSPKEIGKIEKGEILVAEMTNPDYVPAMKKAVAIVTDKGGKTSHAAIVSRELGIPCVVGTEHATKMIKNGELLTVDGIKGIIYKGGLSKSSQTSYQEFQTDKAQRSSALNLKTATKVYVNLAETELAEKVSKMNVDGIGLLRAEFIMAQIGIHPKKMLEQKMRRHFVDTLADNIAKFCSNFNPRPVIYRATDFKTNEYRNLRGGKEFEPHEENPLIGYRGCFRYIKDEKVFEMEIDAIKKVRDEMGFKNLSLMIPFVRTIHEFKEVKKILLANGLSRNGSFNLYIMVEVPSTVILLDEFIDCGIDGVSIGSNDLTMLILGVDRDNERIAEDYYELDPAVLWALERVVKTCVKRKITCSICGQAPSIYPELSEKLVKWGTTSVSVTPDMIDKTREVIYNAEKKMANKK